ncbi:cell division protein FtsW (lipid II flippase) [Anaerobacterium chartisolvens]|uniref:Cell division protein FtsW (Lipid II flippase) n=1 Tax=Anaerobacterium chartisolvens TaxID=1297424 RepID=A0A369B506_9FIRM|nr:FtsW/RodA/SpoVE family cell cycle protein [Anaerobacterium chartisolvens]RCX16609.1 cell division protein FtsW (lipid II flippase) [Anaerobacterium chartisolvens]
MDNRISSFLDNVCIHINCKSVHKDIREELTSHITELRDEYLRKGSTEAEALDMAIASMGDCDEIGNRLNRQHKPQTEWSIIILTAIIALVGGVIMFISSKFESLQAVSFERYLFFAFIGIAVMAALYFFDYTKLKRLALPIYLIALAALIFTVCTGNVIAGRKYISFIGLSVSSNYATLLLLIAFAGFMEKLKNKGGIAIVYLIGIGGVSLLPIVLLPSLSQALVLLAGYAVLMFSAVMRRHFGGSRRLQMFSLGGIAAAGVLALAAVVASEPHRLHRIAVFITRGRSDSFGSGWQQVMADNWLSVSKLFGRTTETISGYGIDMAMPSVTTDYVLINLIATLGWAAGIALIILAALFIIRMLMTARRVKTSYGHYLALASCTVLSLQFIISILMNFNLFPLMGMSLPFISYGGTDYVIDMALVGVILSVWRRNNLIAAHDKPKGSKSGKFIVFEDGKLIINFK